MAAEIAGNNFTARRSTRIATDVLVELQGEGFAFAGETVTVNLHGALIQVTAPLNLGNRIILHVYATGKSTPATVVFANEDRSEFGVELDTPDNIWGVQTPPEDWSVLTSDDGSEAAISDAAQQSV